MAGVLVARHLRRTVRTTGTGKVCAAPVTKRIWSQFQRHAAGRASGYLGTQLDDPVVGVRHRDAVAFVRWVNDITGGEPGYRLPRRDELGTAAVQRALTRGPTVCVWVEHEELWVPPGVDHPHAVDGATLIRYVQNDFGRSKAVVARFLALQATRRLSRSTELPDVDLSSLDADLTFDVVLGVATGVDRAVTGTRRLGFGPNQEVFYEIADSLDRGRPPERTHVNPVERVLGLDKPDSDILVHGALARAVLRGLERTRPFAEWSKALARDFADEAPIDPTATYVVSPDALVGNIGRAQGMLALGRSTDRTLADWVYDVADRLTAKALPLATRDRPLTPDNAAAIRIAALCLAAELYDDDTTDLASIFREIAAGVTLLELRDRGEAPVTETVVLATG
jgi:hypothetical protein